MSKILFAVFATFCVLLTAANASVVSKTLTQQTVTLNNAEVEAVITEKEYLDWWK
jgi:Na+-translocating ferredoxin:NAD+ oxidoreductase RnfG subunit